MDEQIKEILWTVGVSVVGVLCVYLVSPFIAAKLNDVSTKVLDQPLNVDVTQKYVFWILSGICIGHGLYAVLEIASTGIIESMLENISLIYDFDLLNTVIKDRKVLLLMIHDPAIVNSLFIEYNRVLYEQSIKFVLETEAIERMAVVTTLLNDPTYVTMIDNMLIHKSWDGSFLISSELLRRVAPYYRDHLHIISNLTNDYLITISPHLREYYLMKQLHCAWLETGGFPNFDPLTDNIEHVLGLTNQNEINMRLFEAIRRFGSSAGGISNFELALRNLWGDVVVTNNYKVFSFLDGSHILGYSDYGGVSIDQILAKSKFIEDILIQAKTLS